MPRYSGSCHCGAVRFEIDTDITDLYTCDCSLCSKKNALMTTAHGSRFKLLAGEDKLTLYQWNARIARHYFCSVCGVYPFHRKRSMPDHYGVNVRCLDNFDASGVPVRQADGVTMSVVVPNPRDNWSGPREYWPSDCRLPLYSLTTCNFARRALREAAEWNARMNSRMRG